MKKFARPFTGKRQKAESLRGRGEEKKKFRSMFRSRCSGPFIQSYPLSSAFVAVVWELPFTRCRVRILIHPENYSTVICLTTFAILRADRSLSSYLIIFLSFFSFLPFFPSSFLSPRSNRPSRASHERVARSILLVDSRGFRCLKRELISKDEYFIVLVLVISTKKKVISYGR